MSSLKKVTLVDVVSHPVLRAKTRYDLCVPMMFNTHKDTTGEVTKAILIFNKH